ncbi:MAG TPA: ATP-binding protein [Candidatus Limnocylindria bacterium]|nr:ATP-binding protein [Candidatus Limnocylindria bacterium]
MAVAHGLALVSPALSRRATDRWEGLKSLIRTRLLVATLALPIGVLLRPEATAQSWWVMWWSLLAVGVLSALYWLGAAIRRGLTFQIYAQLAGDLMLVTALATLTGGRDSQFVFFYALVVIGGGVLGRLPGGVIVGLSSCFGFVALPWLASQLGVPSLTFGTSPLPKPGMMVAFLAMLGVLAGVLGKRGQGTREHLARAERELDRLRVDNALILQNLTSGVITLDSAAYVTFLNPTAEEVLGVRLDEARGRPVQIALPERLQPLRDALLAVLQQHDRRARDELMVRNAQGRVLPVGVSINVLKHEGAVTGVVAVFQDLTDVRDMERRARRNQTLAEVGALAAAIAHELRNGLNPISGSVECLQRELKLEGENAVLMDLIGTECARLNRFVTDLLGYARERDLFPESFDLEEVLAELCETVGRDPRRKTGQTVRYQPSGRPMVMSADREQLRQVWLNLSVNALEAMPPGGALLVRWSEDERDQVRVEFVDNGPGIAAEDLPRVGQPFFTTKRGGTGLGLAIAQRIVERHGGTLALDSAPGRGTIARVTLPVPAMVAHAA